MVGIYNTDFIDYLEEKLKCKAKINSSNIIVRCPWCELNNNKDHYHLHISIEAPIFHCFHASCERSGIVRKIILALEGKDVSSKFISKEVLDNFKKKRSVFVDKEETRKNIILPTLNPKSFILKQLYLDKRMKFSNKPLTDINGLIFDVHEFIRINNIQMTETLLRIKEYLHSNFIGFLTEHGTTAIFRNIDDSQTMRYYKLKIQESNFIDYYKLPGGNPNSKKIVLAEGIFDIFGEHIFNYLNIKNDVKLYASVLSSKYSMLLKSLIYHEQIFHPDLIILSDNGIPLWQYKNFKKEASSMINTLKVFYNKKGKDFGDSKVSPTDYYAL